MRFVRRHLRFYRDYIIIIFIINKLLDAWVYLFFIFYFKRFYRWTWIIFLFIFRRLRFIFLYTIIPNFIFLILILSIFHFIEFFLILKKIIIIIIIIFLNFILWNIWNWLNFTNFLIIWYPFTEFVNIFIIFLCNFLILIKLLFLAAVIDYIIVLIK